MNLTDAREMANIQGTRAELEVKIYCPRCEDPGKTLVLKVTHDSAYCYNCQWSLGSSDIDSLRLMIQDDSLHERENIRDLM